MSIAVAPACAKAASDVQHEEKEKKSIVEAFVPKESWPKIVADEQTFVAFSKMFFKMIAMGSQAYLQGKFQAMDPLVNDGACELRAMQVHSLATSALLKEEAEKLKKSADAEWRAINNRSQQGKKQSPEECFNTLIKKVEATANMIFILQTHFLAAAKDIKRKDGAIARSYTGTEAEVNSIAKLVIFAPELSKTAVRDAINLSGIVDLVKEQLCMQSRQFLMEMARQVNAKELEASNFFVFKTIVAYVRKHKIPIMVKKIIPKPDKGAAIPPKPPVKLIYCADSPGADLKLVSGLDKTTPVVIFEAVPAKHDITADQLAEAIQKAGGVEEVILCNMVALDDPAKYKDAESSAFQEKAVKKGFVVKSREPLVVENPFLLFEHVTCNLLKHE